MVASYKFIQKLWMLHEKIKDKINNKSNNLDLESNFERFINETISKFDYNLEKFNYNVLIASIYETYNFLNDILESKINGEILLKNYIKILTIISPIIPHFATECFDNLGINKIPSWPEVDKNKTKIDKVNFVIQINGKKKATISSKYNINQKDLLDQLTNDKILSKLIVGKEIEKSFFVKNRLINILLK